MTLHHFRNILQSLNYRVKVLRIAKVETYESARLITNLLRIDNEFGAFDYSETIELLDALMDSCSADVACSVE